MRLESRIRIEGDGTITACSGKVEMGQGIRTAFAMIVAEELAVPVEGIRVILGETDATPPDIGTFGSLSIATDGRALRAAAAFARSILVARAADRLAAPAQELETCAGTVSTRDGRRWLTYQALVAGNPLAGEVPEDVAGGRLPAPTQSAPLRLEALAIVTGAARYVADLRLPGMRFARVLHAPVAGSRLRGLDETAARSQPGVVAIIREEGLAAVVAERDAVARAAARLLDPAWELPAADTIERLDFVLRGDDGVAEALARGARRLRARFHVPYIANAPIGPSAAAADVRDDRADLYVATQRPFGVRDEAARQLELPVEAVHVHPQMGSGTYGRNNTPDSALEAARFSRAVGAPVLVQWSRADEFRVATNRPELSADVEAALDTDGAIIGWRYDETTNPQTYGAAPAGRFAEITAGRNAVPPYRVGRAEVLLHVVPGAVRTGAFRSLAAAPNVFAIESFVDELAHAAGADPLAYRLRHLADRRLRRVLEIVGEHAGWADFRPGAGRGLGVACALYHGTYVAEVAEVSVTPGGRVRLERVVSAVDPGRLVHPDGVRNQIEGGIQQAASWTLLEALPHADGEVAATSWNDYPIATFRDAPRSIEVLLAPDQDAPSTGAGEPGSVPTAAAIANAVFAACGVRVRELPLRPDALRRAAAAS